MCYSIAKVTLLNTNKFISKNLPYKKRVGKIIGEECWRIFPKWKEKYLKDITSEVIQRFMEHIKCQPEKSPAGRLPKMTSGLFFDCCRLGYEANNYDGINEMTSKELYYRHADGRDEGLKDLPEDSVDAFSTWFNDKKDSAGIRGKYAGAVILHIYHYMRSTTNTVGGFHWPVQVRDVRLKRLNFI